MAPPGDDSGSARADSNSPRADGESPLADRSMRTIILTGLAIVVPILITAYVIWFAVGIVQDMLQPIVEVLELAGIETLVTLFAMLVVFGVVAPSGRSHSIDTASGSSRRSIT